MHNMAASMDLDFKQKMPDLLLTREQRLTSHCEWRRSNVERTKRFHQVP